MPEVATRARVAEEAARGPERRATRVRARERQLFAEAVRQQAVVTDAHETSGQNVKEETAQELHGVEGHDTLLAAVGVISPAEADIARRRRR